VGRNTAKLAEVTQKIPNSFPVNCDLTSLDYSHLLKQILLFENETSYKTSVLVNAAGVTLDKLLISSKLSDINNIIAVNQLAPILLSQCIIKKMLKERNGCIVNVASVIGPNMANVGQSIYASSKAALVGFSKSLAKEMSTKGIRVNAVSPGFIATPMTSQLTSQQRNTFIGRIPLGRFGNPDVC
jgi:short-subunit dehydrogenase